MITNRRNLFLVIYTIIHTIISLVLNWTAFGMVMEKFDTLEPFTIWERLHYSLSLLLMQPLLSVISAFPQLGDFLPGILGYSVFLLNSFIWALVIWYFFVVVRRRDRRKDSGTIRNKKKDDLD